MRSGRRVGTVTGQAPEERDLRRAWTGPRRWQPFTGINLRGDDRQSYRKLLWWRALFGMSIAWFIGIALLVDGRYIAEAVFLIAAGAVGPVGLAALKARRH
jgi:hypothetical protein